MSKTKNSETTSIGPKELVRVYKRIHKLLAKRVRQSKKAADAANGKDRVLHKAYIDAAKDLYAYVRIIDVCQNLLKNVQNLNGVLDSLSDASVTFVAPVTKKKDRMN